MASPSTLALRKALTKLHLDNRPKVINTARFAGNRKMFRDKAREMAYAAKQFTQVFDKDTQTMKVKRHARSMGFHQALFEIQKTA